MIYNITEVIKDWLLDRNKPKVEVCVYTLCDSRKGHYMIR